MDVVLLWCAARAQCNVRFEETQRNKAQASACVAPTGVPGRREWLGSSGRKALDLASGGLTLGRRDGFLGGGRMRETPDPAGPAEGVEGKAMVFLLCLSVSYGVRLSSPCSRMRRVRCVGERAVGLRGGGSQAAG